MAEVDDWCLIESDPGVFTEMMKGFGVSGLECEEVYDLSETASIEDALGLIFLFKWEPKNTSDGVALPSEAHNDKIWFARQTIRNACATQAIINILLNLDHSNIKIGSHLTDFKSFVSDFDASLKGTALSNSSEIKSVHNSFSNQQFFQMDVGSKEKDEDVYHFVGYIPINGVVYELDGLRDVPLKHCELKPGQNWVQAIKPVIDSRMKKCMDGNFNLMAIVPDRLEMYQKQLATTTNEEMRTALRGSIEAQRRLKANQIAENVRRKHNYIPLAVELLKVMAREGILVSAVQEATKKAAERRTKAVKT